MGLTTAAGIWASAGIGMAVGMGLYVLAVGGAVLILAVLWLLGMVSARIDKDADEAGSADDGDDDEGDEEPTRAQRFDRPEDVARS